MADKTMNIGKTGSTVELNVTGNIKQNTKQVALSVNNINADANGNVTLPVNTPIKSKTFTHTCSANDANNGRIIFANIDITDKTNFYTPWQVHYLLTVTSTNNSILGYYDVKIGCNGSVVPYYIENNFYTNYYPIYHHTLYRPNSGYSSEGAMIGVRVQSASSPTIQRTYKIDVLEEIGCTMNFRDSIGTYGNLYNSTKWTYGEYNGTSLGLQEYGDNDTYTTDQLSNYRLTVDSEMPLCHGCLFGYTRGDKAVPFSAYTASYTSYTTSLNTARVYPTHGIDWTKGMYATYSWTYRAKNTTATEQIRTFMSALDFRYSDNCIPLATATTLGMVDNKRVFVKGVIKSDGLFYITPMEVTYNGSKYKKFWTQDIPTSVETDANGNQYYYWYIGMPYYDASYAGSLYRVNFEEDNPMYFHDGTNFVQLQPYAARSKVADTANNVAWANTNHPTFSTVATSGSYNDLTNKPTIPSAVTESTVSGWGFTKNTGTYSKPSGGIPASDLAQSYYLASNPNGYTSNTGTVTAVKINGTTKNPTNGVVDLGTISGGGGGGITTETDPVFSASAAAGITADNITKWNTASNFTPNAINVTTMDISSNATSTGKTYMHVNLTSPGLWIIIGMLAFDSSSGVKGVGLMSDDSSSPASTTGNYSSRTTGSTAAVVRVQVIGYYSVASGTTKQINLNGYASSSTKIESGNLRAICVGPPIENLED